MNECVLLISTGGTSLLTNGDSDDHRWWLTQVANDVHANSARITSIVDERRLRLRAADATTRRKMSAEFDGISVVLHRYKPQQLLHLLLHSDTAPGKATGDLVQEALGNQALVVSASGLCTNELALFSASFADFTMQVEALVRSYREEGWFVIFNLRGRFKLLNG